MICLDVSQRRQLVALSIRDMRGDRRDLKQILIIGGRRLSDCSRSVRGADERIITIIISACVV